MNLGDRTDTVEKEISLVMSGFVLVCFFFAMGFYKNTAWENPEKNRFASTF